MYYHRGAINHNMKSLKNSLSTLFLLTIPQDSTAEYNDLIDSIKNIKVERMLDQPSENRPNIKDVFVKGNQESIDNVISLIANIVICVRCWVKMLQNDTDG